MADDLTELQEMLAHQAMEISRLSEEMYAQQKEIRQLKQKLGRFLEAVESLSHLRSEAEETPPPHY